MGNDLAKGTQGIKAELGLEQGFLVSQTTAVFLALNQLSLQF